MIKSKKFWNWMIEKEYASKMGTERYFLRMNQMYSDIFSNQMLIGFMIEYLIEERNLPWGFITIKRDEDDTIDGIFKLFEKYIKGKK